MGETTSDFFFLFLFVFPPHNFRPSILLKLYARTSKANQSLETVKVLNFVAKAQL